MNLLFVIFISCSYSTRSRILYFQGKKIISPQVFQSSFNSMCTNMLMRYGASYIFYSICFIINFLIDRVNFISTFIFGNNPQKPIRFFKLLLGTLISFLQSQSWMHGMILSLAFMTKTCMSVLDFQSMLATVELL